MASLSVQKSIPQLPTTDLKQSVQTPVTTSEMSVHQAARDKVSLSSIAGSAAAGALPVFGLTTLAALSLGSIGGNTHLGDALKSAIVEMPLPTLGAAVIGGISGAVAGGEAEQSQAISKGAKTGAALGALALGVTALAMKGSPLGGAMIGAALGTATGAAGGWAAWNIQH